MRNHVYQRIITHASYDGALAAGILSQLYDLPIEFVETTASASEAILLGVPLGSSLGFSSCMILTNFACKAIAAQVGPGNVVICREDSSLSRLVADVVEVDVPDHLLELADGAECMGRPCWSPPLPQASREDCRDGDL